MESWKFHDINFEGQTKPIEGINIWSLDWIKSELDNFKAPHPQHSNQSHLMRTYFVEFGGKRVDFAVAEVSNLVWTVYALENVT